MNLSSDEKRLIQNVINVFETGSPDGDYGAISIYHDGPNDIRQITYGRSQTTEYGNLRKLIHMYVEANALYSNELRSYSELIGSEALTDKKEFKSLLRKAGRSDPEMKRIQDQFFDEQYYKPAIIWGQEHGFNSVLSALVIYDSFIHSGRILWFLRQRFTENPPSLGGSEERWITEYVNARHNWLSNHQRTILRKTIYRTECFKREINRNNWDLSELPINANGIDVY